MFIGQSNIAAFPLVWLLKDSEQYSVHRLIISLASVMHFPYLSWMVFILPFFSLVRSCITRNALSLLFLFRLSSIVLVQVVFYCSCSGCLLLFLFRLSSIVLVQVVFYCSCSGCLLFRCTVLLSICLWLLSCIFLFCC